MDDATKEMIRHIAWNATVGRGCDPEECSEPDHDAVEALRRALGPKMCSEALSEFVDAWLKCIQEMEQP